MSEYKRLTSYMQVGDKIVAIQPQRKERIQEYISRLFELEDKIENGTLVELQCKCIEELNIIKKGMISIFYKMCLEQNFGQEFFLKYKSKINDWFKNYRRNRNEISFNINSTEVD